MAVLLRILATAFLGNTVAPLPGAFDQVWYDALAQRLANGHGFSFAEAAWPNTPADTPTAFWSFLYTGFLAAIYSLVGHQPLIARLVQAVIVGILLPWGTWKLARRTVGDSEALVAALLTSVYIYFIYYSAVLMTEMVTIVAVVWLLVVIAELADWPTTKRWVALGVIVGLAGLLRQVVLVPVPLLCLWILWRHRTRRVAVGIALAAAVAMAFVAPVTIRNARVFDRFVLLNTNAGYAFFWANHPVHGTDFKQILGSQAPSYQDLIPPELRHLNEAALNDALMTRGWQFVTDDPIRYARLSFSRIPDYFRFWPSSDSTSLSNAARVASFGLMWPLMVAGLWLTRRDWRRTMPLLIFAAVYTIVHLMSWALIRYRLPVDAVLLVFAAVAVYRYSIAWSEAQTAGHEEGRALHESK